MTKFAMTVLDKALTMRRPHNDAYTRKFCDWLCRLLPGNFVDPIGNIHVDLRSNPNHKTLFVAHVDTVHRRGGKNRIVKIGNTWRASRAPLGADDGAGVAVLMHMIQHKVPGYYIFTQGEECGGIGSRWLADNRPDLLREFKRAVAFDRRSTYSVITHQGFGGRCASDKFGQALADALNAQGMLFMPDDTGVYTDTAEFTHLIAECTNLSVGYDMEHSEREMLDIRHFKDLCLAAVKINWDALPVERDPAADVTQAFKDYLGSLGDWATLPMTASKNAMADRELQAAIIDAFDGKHKSLVQLIAQVVNPLDPKVAERLIDTKRFTETFLADLMIDSEVMDSDTLLMQAWDQVGILIH